MNIFAGTISLHGNKSVDLDYDLVEILGKNGNKTLYIIGETACKTQDELLSYFEEKVGKIEIHDISFSTHKKIEIFGGGYEEGIYERVSLEGEQVSFSEVCERFEDTEEVVAVREGDVSQRFGNNIIHVDFVF